MAHDDYCPCKHLVAVCEVECPDCLTEMYGAAVAASISSERNRTVNHDALVQRDLDRGIHLWQREQPPLKRRNADHRTERASDA